MQISSSSETLESVGRLESSLSPTVSRMSTLDNSDVLECLQGQELVPLRRQFEVENSLLHGEVLNIFMTGRTLLFLVNGREHSCVFFFRYSQAQFWLSLFIRH